MAGTSSPQQPQVTHPDATAVGDELEDAQGLHAVSNVEVGVVLALESVQPIGDEDSDDNDDIQQVVAVLPVVDGVHIELHAELRAIDGHKDQLGDLRGGGVPKIRGSGQAAEPHRPSLSLQEGPNRLCASQQAEGTPSQPRDRETQAELQAHSRHTVGPILFPFCSFPPCSPKLGLGHTQGA